MVDRSELTNDPELVMRQALQGMQARLWTTFPGIVQKVDWGKLTCTVQPAIQGQVEDENGNNSFVDLPLLLDCPIQFLACAGFVIKVPVAANDEVLVHVANRCIDSWWESGGVQPPAEFRMHDLSDGFACPGVYSKPNVPASLSSTDLEIMKTDGSAKISIKPSGEIDITGNTIKLTGNVVITGNIQASGTIQDASGVDLATHQHGGITAGSGLSGPPVA